MSRAGQSRATDPLRAAARATERRLRARRVVLTMGGEPTWIPVRPEGPEWHHAAVGPTKLGFAVAFAEALRREGLPGAVAVLAPGKHYAGEVNPRWALRLLWRRDGVALAPRAAVAGAGRWERKPLERLARRFRAALGVRQPWIAATDPVDPTAWVRVLPLDWVEGAWVGARWPLPRPIGLVETEGPAGLRLPLKELPEDCLRRALVLECRGGVVDLFIPPYLEPGFFALLEAFDAALPETPDRGPVRFAGYPPGASEVLDVVTLASDPGVIEGNLPPCRTWEEYDGWLRRFCRAAESAGLRSFRVAHDGSESGTGGGNHVLFGGPPDGLSPFFARPGWVASMLRYWHRHPALAYAFTGIYAGPSSQAPRADESGQEPVELEIACGILDRLPPGDHRDLIARSLRNLLTDRTGNAHRAEIALDKFWDPGSPAGCMGLIEFRAIESLPRPEWMSAVALLWRSILAMLLDRPEREPVAPHGAALHDRFFLPAFLRADLERVLDDLEAHGIALPRTVFREILDWRFPALLEADGVTVRAAHESWPLVGDSAAGTSRLVDASLRRIECTVPAGFLKSHRLTIQGRLPVWSRFPEGRGGFGLRFNALLCASAVHPSLLPDLPLELAVRSKGARTERVWVLDPGAVRFRDAGSRPARPIVGALAKAGPDRVTCDLRLGRV